MKRQEVINILSKHFLDNYSKDLKNYEILKQSYILAMKSLNITQQEYSLLYDTFGSDFTKKYYNEISKEEATDILIKDFLDNHSDNSPKLKEAYDFVIKASDGKYKECDIIKSVPDSIIKKTNQNKDGYTIRVKTRYEEPDHKTPYWYSCCPWFHVDIKIMGLPKHKGKYQQCTFPGKTHFDWNQAIPIREGNYNEQIWELVNNKAKFREFVRLHVREILWQIEGEIERDNREKIEKEKVAKIKNIQLKNLQ